jgi:heterodisulfide reductase subunit A2
MNTSREVVVIGAGTAGMEVSGQLSAAGIKVTLIDGKSAPGGNVAGWHMLFPDRRDSKEIVNYLDGIIRNELVTLLPDTSVTSVERKGSSILVKTSGTLTIQTDAVVLATGFDLFNCSRKEEYGFGIYNNVITSADLEVLFGKEEVTTVNGSKPSRIGMVHCVGSRDEKVGNLYCSKLCCVTAVKQAIEIKERLPECEVFCFYMDMRMGGAYYEELYREAQEKWGVNFIRGKVSEAGVTINKRLTVKVEDTLAGRPLKMELDILVLMAGMEMSQGGKTISLNSGLKTGENRFFEPSDHIYGSNLSNIPGVFYAGTCTAPMNIPDTISHARSAASEVIKYLKSKNS